MKILIVTEFFPTGKDLNFSGGVEARTFYIAKILAKKHEVAVISSNDTGQRVERMFNFTVYRVGKKRSYNAIAGDLISRIFFIRAAINKGNGMDIDIVEGTNFITHFVAKRISESKKIPVIAWYPDVWIGSWIKNSGLFGILGGVLERYNLWRGFDSYIAISKKTAEKLNKFNLKNVNVIYCGVEEAEFKIKVKKEKNVIICVSRLAKYKRIKTLILAFAFLNRKYPDLKLVIVGRGPEERYLKGLAESLKISSKIRFMENLPRKTLVSYIKSAYIFSLPSEVEGFGIVIIESMMAGVPYVISDIDVFKEITEEGKGGLFFELGSPISLARKIERLLSSEKFYLKKVEEGRELAKKFVWRNIAYQTEAVFERTLKNFSS